MTTTGICSYLRVSTGRQRDAATIETQRTVIADYCRHNGIPVEDVREFADNGVSSRVPFRGRAGSSALFEVAKQGQARILLVYRFDRLGRDGDTTDTQTAVGQLWKLGIKTVISMKQGPIEDNPHGRFMLGIHSAVGGYERDSTVEKTMDSSRRLAKTEAGAETMWMGGVAPYGYRQVGEDRQARLALSEEPISDACKFSEVDVIRLIFEKAADGETCYEIAKYLNNVLGILPAYADPHRDERRGGREGEKKRRTTKGIWWSTGLGRILANRTYMGEHDWGKEKVFWDESGKGHLKPQPREKWITRTCPAIVTEDLWKRANAMRQQKRNASMGHPTHKYLLRGLIRCQCGRTYIGVTAKQRNGTERKYYRCASKYADRSIRDTCPRCPAPGYRGEALEASVWDYVAGFLARPGLATKELKSQMAAETEEGRVAKTIKDLEGSRARKIEGRKSVLRQLGEGLFPEAEVKDTVQRIDAEVSGIDQQLVELRNIAAKKETRLLSLDWAGRLLGDLGAELRNGELTFDRKREFVESLVAGIKVTNDGAPPVVTFRFDPDFTRLQKWGREWARSHGDLVPANTGPHPK